MMNCVVHGKQNKMGNVPLSIIKIITKDGLNSQNDNKMWDIVFEPLTGQDKL